jgi:prolyl-tRNA editing enzyme YbaK/EbsC (Cys-tRNA(Pro) deacylase)
MDTLLPVVATSLDAAGIQYSVFECDPELADTSAFCGRYGFSEEESANTIIVVGKSEPVQYAACVLLATTKLDVNKAVCKALGVRKVSFAPMESALAISGMEYGGVTVFGLLSDIPVYVDSRVYIQRRVVMGGGNRSSKVVLDPKELQLLASVQIIQDLARPKQS